MTDNRVLCMGLGGRRGPQRLQSLRWRFAIYHAKKEVEKRNLLQVRGEAMFR